MRLSRRPLLALAAALSVIPGSVGAQDRAAPAVSPSPAASPSPSPAPSAVPPDASTDAEDLLGRLQARYQSTRTLRIEFTQRYLNRATGRTLEESGVLVAAKPGRMRWEYRDPEKLFVLKDDQSWFYIPEEKVAYRMQTGPEEARRVPALLLAGKADLVRDYRPSLEPGEGTDVRLRLDPRRAGEDYQQVIVRLAPASLTLRGLAVVDVLGNMTEFEFRAEETGVAIPEGSFEFKPPRGVEVVEAR